MNDNPSDPDQLATGPCVMLFLPVGMLDVVATISSRQQGWTTLQRIVGDADDSVIDAANLPELFAIIGILIALLFPAVQD